MSSNIDTLIQAARGYRRSLQATTTPLNLLEDLADALEGLRDDLAELHGPCRALRESLDAENRVVLKLQADLAAARGRARTIDHILTPIIDSTGAVFIPDIAILAIREAVTEARRITQDERRI